MLLVAGLGNKGENYKLTRHNIGFIIIDYLTSYFSLASFSSKFKSSVCESLIEQTKVLFLKPQTFMNNSGEAILSASSFYKIEPTNIIIFYDDIDLPLGKVRYKINSGSGGHNGIKSIQSHIGNNFHRIKIGIGKPQIQAVDSYVLSNFSKLDLEQVINPLLQNIAKNFNFLIKQDFKTFIELTNKETLWV